MKHCSLVSLVALALMARSLFAVALLASVALSGEMVFVPAGNFTMGSTAGYPSEQPVHTAYLNAFYIDKYEVTNAQFKSFIDAGGYTTQAFWSAAGWTARTSGGWTLPRYWAGGYYHSGREWPDFPAVGVSWYEAEAYANFAGKRLPTEAEWEKAARGTDQRTYPWGNILDGSRTNYVGSGDPYDDSSTPVGFYDGRLHPSPSFQTTDSPSPYGAYDMAGNVWEWVTDWYQENYYSVSPPSNPPGPLSGSYRVMRGGAWNFAPDFLRSAYRLYSAPSDRGRMGFRCARHDLEDQPAPTLSDAYSIAENKVRVVFDRNVDVTTAENDANYTLGSAALGSVVTDATVVGGSGQGTVFHSLNDGTHDTIPLTFNEVSFTYHGIDTYVTREPTNPTPAPVFVSGAFFPAGLVVTKVHLITYASWALDLPDGTEVGKVILHYSGCAPAYAIPLVIGQTTAEWAYDRPDAQGCLAHSKIRSREARNFPAPEAPALYTGHEYYSSWPVSPGVLQSIEIQVNWNAYSSEKNRGADCWTPEKYNFGVSAVTLEGYDPSNGSNTVDLTIADVLPRLSLESIQTENIGSAADPTCLSPQQSREFVLGVLSCAEVQAPQEGSLLADPCLDRSRFAGPGATCGPRLTVRGVMVKSYPKARQQYFADAAGGARSGVAAYNVPFGPVVGHQYLLACAATEYYGMTELSSPVALIDEGPVAVPAPVVVPVAVLTDQSCDATQTITNAEDYEGRLVRIDRVKVVPFNVPPTEPVAGGSFRVVQDRVGYVADTILVSNYDGLCAFDATSEDWLNVIGVMHYNDGGGSTIRPRGDSDITRLDEPTPTLLSLVSADVSADGINLAWFMGGSVSAVATVYRSSVGGEWMRIGEVTADGAGYLRYTDPIDATATRVGYRLGIIEAGIEGFYGETWVDLPTRNVALTFALAYVRPNPSHGERLSVAFTLPTAAPARLELLDVSGRRVVEREVGSLGAGPHAVDLGQGTRLAPGLYLVRLTQGANTRVARVAVLQ
jgi:formylglycine-generating enzyme required for sulfatase activity